MWSLNSCCLLVQIFLSTRWAILLNLHAEMFRTNTYPNSWNLLLRFSCSFLQSCYLVCMYMLICWFLAFDTYSCFMEFWKISINLKWHEQSAKFPIESFNDCYLEWVLEYVKTAPPVSDLHWHAISRMPHYVGTYCGSSLCFHMLFPSLLLYFWHSMNRLNSCILQGTSYAHWLSSISSIWWILHSVVTT